MHDIVPLTNGPKTTLPNDGVIQVSCEGYLLFDKLSKHASKAFIYLNLSNESLLSIWHFCDNDCIAVFTKSRVYIIKDNDLVVEGFWNTTDGLWDIKLPSSPTKWTPLSPKTPQINYIITKDKSKSELAQYFLATVFSPTISTFTYAINNGNFVTWPGISELNFKKILGTAISIEKGHIDQERKNYDPLLTKKNMPIFSLRKQKTKSTIYLLPSKRIFLRWKKRHIPVRQEDLPTNQRDAITICLLSMLMMVTPFLLNH